MSDSLQINLFDRFHWPVGCPAPAKAFKDTSSHVSNWLKTEGKNKNLLQKTSAGTYIGIGTLGIGAIGWLFSSKSENPFLKYSFGFLGLLGTATTLIGKLCGYEFNAIDSIHEKVLYNPPTKLETTPEEKGINHENIEIKISENEFLKGYFIPAPGKNETKKTAIYLHGRGENVSHCLEKCKKLQEVSGVNILLMDYRGFGESKSETQISKETLVSDAEAMYDYLIKEKKLTPEDISLYGHSLGGHIAVELASKKKVHSLVLQSTFSSIQKVVEGFSRLLPNFVDRNNSFDSGSLIKKITAPILIIHGDKDEVISESQAKELFDIAVSRINFESSDLADSKQRQVIPQGVLASTQDPFQNKFIVVPGAKHNDISKYFDESPRLRMLVNKFLAA